MTLPIVKAAKESDEVSVIDALKLGFVSDPATRWTWPDPQKYLLHFPSFAKAIGGKAFAHGGAYYVGNYSGAALWLPPNLHPDVVVSLLPYLSFLANASSANMNNTVTVGSK